MGGGVAYRAGESQPGAGDAFAFPRSPGKAGFSLPARVQASGWRGLRLCRCYIPSLPAPGSWLGSGAGCRRMPGRSLRGDTGLRALTQRLPAALDGRGAASLPGRHNANDR